MSTDQTQTTTPSREDREAARLERKRALAAQQADRFEDELSSHELNEARLEAVPEAARDEAWQQQRAQVAAAVETITLAIETTLAIVDETAPSA